VSYGTNTAIRFGYAKKLENEIDYFDCLCCDYVFMQ
jgi:hypothetical protein